MKWKKVSEYPLPDGDGEKLYIMKFKDVYSRYDDFKLTSNFHPKRINLEGLSVLEWCEFNPDEIESADSAEYKFENFSREDIKGEFTFNDFEPSILTPQEQQIVDGISGILDFKKLCDDKPTSATEVEIDSSHQQENTLQQGHAPIEFKGSCEPSWEEKFRWETARDIFCAFLSNNTTSEQFLCYQLQASAISEAENFIEELKRGRE